MNGVKKRLTKVIIATLWSAGLSALIGELFQTRWLKWFAIALVAIIGIGAVLFMLVSLARAYRAGGIRQLQHEVLPSLIVAQIGVIELGPLLLVTLGVILLGLDHPAIPPLGSLRITQLLGVAIVVGTLELVRGAYYRNVRERVQQRLGSCESRED